jgi:hypothetical protein
MQTLDAMLPANAGERKTLADIIFAKLEDGDAGNAAAIQKSHQSVLFGIFSRTPITDFISHR